MSTPTNIPETPMGGTVPGSFLESKEKFYLQLQNIFQTILRVNDPDQFDQLCQWMEYKQFHTFDDFYDFYRDCSEKLDAKNPEAEYKWKGKTNHLSANVAHKLKSFVQWMAHENKPHDLHDDYLASLTRENYFNFRFLCTQSPLTLPPSHHESQQLMTSFPSEFKQPTQSETKTALNNFKKGTKRDASVYPIFKNDKYYDTFQRSFFANLKAQGLYDVADPDYDTESGDIYEQELFQGKQSFVYSVLVTSLQTEKGRELVKEFEGDARSIILKLHHYHTKSNVAQHDIITLTTDITNLTLNDSWKGTVRQFLSHFKEKLRLLDSLVPVSDQLPETTRITFLQRAVQQNHDLRQIHVMDSVWRFKTESTDTLTLRPTTTFFGMQLISMISTTPRRDLRERHSYPNMRKSTMKMDISLKQNNLSMTLTQKKNLLHTQFFNPPFILRLHRHPTFLLKSGKHFLKAPNKWSLSTTRKSSSTTLHHTLVGARLNLTLHWVSPTLLHNKFISIHKMMPKKNHLLTLLPKPW